MGECEGATRASAGKCVSRVGAACANSRRPGKGARRPAQNECARASGLRVPGAGAGQGRSARGPWPGGGSWRAAAEARGDKAGGGGERGRARPSGRPRSHGRGKEGGDARGREEDGGVKAAERRGAGAERAAAAAAVAPAGAVQGSAAGSGSGVSSALPASLPAGGDRRTKRRVRAVRGRGEYPAADRARPNPQTLGLTDRHRGS